MGSEANSKRLRGLRLATLIGLIACAAMAARAGASAGATTRPADAPQTTVAHRMPVVSGNEDPFLWLEDVRGARALAWVKAQDAKTAAALEGDPRYRTLYAQALKISESKSRIPYPQTIAGSIYNFWQDATHVRGILRRTTLGSYRTAAPQWTTVLDLDALAKSERANWVWEGIDCVKPEETRCLVSLSDGGEDAQTIREFDLRSRRFTPGGFGLPRAKQSFAWSDPNTLLVARPWTPGEVTASGYPYDVRKLVRGQPLAAASEIYRGLPSDVGVSPLVLHDGSGDQIQLIERDVTFFTSEYYVLTPNGLRKLGLPQEVNIAGMLAGRLLVRLNQRWQAANHSFPAGALVSLDVKSLEADPAHLRPTSLYAPGPRESLDSVAVTKDRVLLATYRMVKGRALVYAPESDGGWSRRQLDLPDNSSIGLIDANLRNDTAFLGVTSFLTPTYLYIVDAATGRAASIKRLPAEFDASKDIVEQHEATSKDGTQIPYFIVRSKNMVFDAANPTVLYAYGGFQVSITPFYNGQVGKLWLERGGVFAVANIRGGGEFGPAWHDAGLKTHRQRIYDDFYAVARDLVARKITAPRYLGIQGGSNGGLLMGVEFTQHPEMWNAVDMQVPLLDMLRYEKIEAGASWVGEYGSVSVPAERAFLASISPYQNLKPGVTYPEPLIWTTTKDDRVGPQHARKFAAKLNAMGVPCLFYEVTEGGHGSGANLAERAHTSALEWTYFTQKLMRG
jgi:prolyl oligopeptidase